MNIEKVFQQHTELVKLLPSRPNDNDLLLLYGLYKQVIIGDCNISKPNGLFNIKDKKKWEAWNKNMGLSKEEAQMNYIKKVQELMESL